MLQYVFNPEILSVPIIKFNFFPGQQNDAIISQCKIGEAFYDIVFIFCEVGVIPYAFMCLIRIFAGTVLSPVPADGDIYQDIFSFLKAEVEHFESIFFR